MSETFDRVRASAFVREKVLLGMAPKVYAKSLFTKTNAIFAAILAIGLPTMAYRFWKGMGAVTNLSQTNPWGIWVAFDIVCGVALAAGGYTVAAAVYLFGQKQFRPVLRPAILTGFLGYAVRRRRPHGRPRPAVAAPLPVLPHARDDRRHVRGRLVRVPVPDGPRPRVPSRRRSSGSG